MLWLLSIQKLSLGVTFETGWSRFEAALNGAKTCVFKHYLVQPYVYYLWEGWFHDKVDFFWALNMRPPLNDKDVHYSRNTNLCIVLWSVSFDSQYFSFSCVSVLIQISFASRLPQPVCFTKSLQFEQRTKYHICSVSLLDINHNVSPPMKAILIYSQKFDVLVPNQWPSTFSILMNINHTDVSCAY